MTPLCLRPCDHDTSASIRHSKYSNERTLYRRPGACMFVCLQLANRLDWQIDMVRMSRKNPVVDKQPSKHISDRKTLVIQCKIKGDYSSWHLTYLHAAIVCSVEWKIVIYRCMEWKPNFSRRLRMVEGMHMKKCIVPWNVISRNTNIIFLISHGQYAVPTVEQTIPSIKYF